MADNSISIILKLQAEKAQKQLKKIASSADKAEKEMNSLRKSSQGLSKGFKILAGAAAAVGLFRLGQGLVNLGTSAVSAAGNLEMLESQFKVLTESASDARIIVKDLTEFASKTPFRLEGIGAAAKSLLAFGVTTDDLQNKLQILGDVSSVTGKDFKELAVIFGQIKNRSQLTGDNLRQLNEAGVAIGPALVKSMGVAKEAIRPLMEQGKIGFEEFEKAFETLNKKGGQAFKGMEIASKTLNGRISTLRDNVGLLNVAIGSKFAPSVKGIAIVFNKFAKRLTKSATVMNFFAESASKIPILIGSIGATVNSLNNAFNNFRKILIVLPATVNEFTLSIQRLQLSAQETSKSIQAFFGRKLPGIDENIAKTKELIKSMEDAANFMAEDMNTIENSQRSMSDIIKSTTNEIVTAINDEMKAAQDAANSKVIDDGKKIDSTVRLTFAEIEAMRLREEAAKETAEKLIDAEKQVQIAKEANRLFDTEAEVLFQDERLIRLEEHFTREQEAALQATILLAENAQQRELIITEIQAKGLQQRLKDKAANVEAQKQLETASSSQLLSATGSLFGALGSLAAAGGKRMFEISKAFNIAEAITSGILAVQKALALPPPANIIAASAMAIKTGANVARINAVKPAFEQGGFVGGSSFSGDNVDVRVNSGEAILNSRQQREFMSIANGSGNNNEAVLDALENISAQLSVQQPTIIEIDGAAIAQTVKNETDKGFNL